MGAGRPDDEGTDTAASSGARGGRHAQARMRQCVLTRTERPTDEMLRFVAGPDGAIAPDVTGKLGGRGVWLTATRVAVDQAVKRNAFSKALKLHIKAPAGLADLVERQLLERTRQALAFANKAGLVTTGFVKVEKAIEHGQVALLVEAADAAADGADKLRRKFIAVASAANRPAMLFKALRSADLSLAIGRPNVVHAALAEGGQCDAFQRECQRLERFVASAGGLIEGPARASDAAGDEAREVADDARDED